jgi:hypothetical protein
MEGLVEPLNSPLSWAKFVGCFATRVTLYSQQVRALNLINQLAEGGELPVRKEDTVGIVGAGVAGITAATALALVCPELSIDILEKRGSILKLQRESSSRFLRPRIYDWPASNASTDDAGLPILNWKAKFANEVAADIATDFDTLAGWDKERVKVLKGHEVTDVKPGEGFYELTVECATGRLPPKSYKWVIICIGFGIEKKIEAINPGYWEPRTSMLELDEPRIFVSGNGDGGLIDFALAAFDESDHASIENLIINYSGLELPKKKLEEIDKEAKALQEAGRPPLDLYKEYEKIFVPNNLIEKISDKLRKKGQVMFHTREEQLFGSCKTSKVRHRLNIPHDDVGWHFRYSGLDEQITRDPCRRSISAGRNRETDTSKGSPGDEDVACACQHLLTGFFQPDHFEGKFAPFGHPGH